MPEFFEIAEIGSATAPTAGLPDSCELCGHCRILREMARQRGRETSPGCGRGHALAPLEPAGRSSESPEKGM